MQKITTGSMRHRTAVRVALDLTLEAARGVAGELLAFGQELERSRAAQVGASFSGDAAADELIRSSPNAFLLGVLFAQGIPAERAWSAPARLRERLGTLDPAFLAANPEAVRDAVQAPPMLHRFKETVPRWIVAMASRLIEHYGGDARTIWPPGAHVLEVTERLAAFDGIGRKKAVMAAEILRRHFKVPLVGCEASGVAYDVHVRRVFLRTGLARADTPAEIDAAASRVCPASPGTLDLAAWLVGREWCRPRAPRCDRCRLGATCPRRVWISVEGVGHANRSSIERMTSPESSFG